MATNSFGVAYDAELVGANIDYLGSGPTHMSYVPKALQDITKLKDTEANGGEGMNIVAVNMSSQQNKSQCHYGTVTELSDGTFPNSKNYKHYGHTVAVAPLLAGCNRQ